MQISFFFVLPYWMFNTYVVIVSVQKLRNYILYLITDKLVFNLYVQIYKTYFSYEIPTYISSLALLNSMGR